MRLNLCLFLLLLIGFAASAQTTPPPADTAAVVTAPTRERKPQLEALSNPSKAALYSAVLPGAGQLYNKNGYWYKIPVIYGGFAVFGYLVVEYNQRYLEMRNYERYLSDSNPSNDALIPAQFAGQTVDNFGARKDDFRRDRDYNIILASMWYGFQIAEAVVTAHLKPFDVSDDLSLRIKPTSFPTATGTTAGLGLVLEF
jgi:hypothetical protein